MTLTDVLLDLLQRADARDEEASLVDQDEVAAWPSGALELVTECGLLASAAPATSVHCDACDDDHWELPIWASAENGGEPRAYIRCPTFGLQRVMPARLRRYQVSLVGLAGALARLPRTEVTPRELTQGRIWHLGQVDLQGESGALLLVRGIAWGDGADLLRQLGLAVAVGDAWALSLSPPPVRDATWPVPTMHLPAVLSLGDAGLAIRRDALRGGPAASVPAGHEDAKCIMRRSGGAWFIRYDGVEDTIPHLVGLGYLAVLLRNPMHTFRPEELVSLAGAEIAETVTGSEASAAGLRTWHEAEGPVLDEEAVKQIQQRIAVLQSKRSWGTLNSSELAELQALQRHLRSAMGLGKQPRRMTSEHGKLRASVAKAISYARNKIGEHNPVLALFLEHAVKTRGGFTYEPDRPISWLP